MLIPFIFLLNLTIGFFFLSLYLHDYFNFNVISIKFAKIKSIINHEKVSVIIKVSFLLICALIPINIFLKLLGEDGHVMINNIGYLPTQNKTFFLATRYDHQYNGSFVIINQNTQQICYSGDLLRKGYKWEQYHWVGNFTNFTTPGNFYIKTKLGPWSWNSYNFDIDAQYMERAFLTGQMWYYYNRCGTTAYELVPNYKGHELCHQNDAWYLYKYPNGSLEYRRDLNLTGGWHDSGDYNVYGTRIPPLCYSLTYCYSQVPNFFQNETQMTVYPENNSIPDIIEEAWFGAQFWLRRWYTPEQKWFDSDSLGENGHLRWSIFVAPEYEEDFGNGRYVDDDDNNQKSYNGQFLWSTSSLLVIASLADFVRICRDQNFYLDNLTQIESMILAARQSYASFIKKEYRSLVCEQALYELTLNQTYLLNAIQIANTIIANSQNYSTFPDYLDYGLTLAFIQKFNGINGWTGMTYLQANNSLQMFDTVLINRTKDPENLFNFVRFPESNGLPGGPGKHNGYYLSAIIAASYAWNLTTDPSQKVDFFEFITNHFDWLYGRNMENVCMLEGVPGGENFPFEYHQRVKFIPGRLRGEGAGYIADGFEYFPGDYGTGNDANQYVIRKQSYIYRETWSDVTFRYMMANAAFFHQVLQYT
jgi:hypothetical protein